MRIVVFTGAGISAESGIQTFRDGDGLWNDYKVEEVASISGWRRDKQRVLDFYNRRRVDMLAAKPNKAHILLAELEKDHDVTIITQNVDDLHEKAGSTKVVHLHGELSKMCSSNDKTLTQPYDRDINVGDKHEDGSQLRPFVIWFGEGVPMMWEASRIVKTAEIFVIIGTSLQVYPAVELLRYTELVTPKGLVYIDPNASENIKDFEGDVDYTIIEKSATEGVQDLVEILKYREI